MKLLKFLLFVWPCLMFVAPAFAHDPVFGLGPHVLFKDGVELHFGALQEKASNDRSTEAEVQLTYGLTGIER